jgi:hypothetical protein
MTDDVNADPIFDPALADPASAATEIGKLRQRIADLERSTGPASTRPGSPPPEGALPLESDGQPMILRSWLRDSSFFRRNKAAILRAASKGRIVDDLADWKVDSKASDRARAAYRARASAAQVAKAKEGTR